MRRCRVRSDELEAFGGLPSSGPEPGQAADAIILAPSNPGLGGPGFSSYPLGKPDDDSGRGIPRAFMR
jgi:hypothetical protein